MKRTFLLLSAMIGCACWFQARAAESVSYYVSSTYGSDEENDEGTKENPFRTVTKAISLVAPNTPTVIYLEKDAVFLETGSTSSSRINFPADVDLEIIGENSTIQAFPAPPTTNQYNRIFRIASGSVKLKGLILENGYPGNVGGAIFFAGETLEIDSCLFRNNTAGESTGNSGGGGAIASRGKNLIIRNSYFQGNVCYGGSGGGAVLHAGNKGTLVVENTTFDRNVLSTGDSNGSVFSFYEVNSTNKGPGKISITNCTFYNNTITNRDAGGAGAITLHASMNATEACVVNNTFLFDQRFPLTEADEGKTDPEKAKTIYRRNVGVRVEGTAHQLHFINNVVSGLRYAVSATHATGRKIVAKNNYMITMGKHMNVNEFDAVQENTADENGNILMIQTTSTGDPLQSDITALDENMPMTGLATSLCTDSIIPYLAIVDENSPLINNGLNTYSVHETEQVPTTDVLGTLRASAEAKTGDKTDIGAFEYVSGPLVALEEEPAWEDGISIGRQADGILLRNYLPYPVSLSIVGMEGRLLSQMRLSGSLTISRSELPRGVLIFIFDDGTTKIFRKVLL